MSVSSVRGGLVQPQGFAGIGGALERTRAFARTHRKSLRAATISACTGVVILSGVIAMQLAPSRTTSYERSLIVPARSSQQSLHIANSGLVHLQGARVAAVSSGSIAVVSEWSSGTFRWNIHLTPDTKIVLSNGEIGSRTDIRVGDFVGVTGDLAGGSSSPIVSANAIRLSRAEKGDVQVVNLTDLE